MNGEIITFVKRDKFPIQCRGNHDLTVSMEYKVAILWRDFTLPDMIDFFLPLCTA